MYQIRNIPRTGLLYCLWSVAAVALALAAGGMNNENVTRILVIAFLLVQLVFKQRLCSLFARLAPRLRFIICGTVFAAVVEGFHMISRPVFLSLKVDGSHSLAEAARFYLIDLLFTVPAYLVILAVIFWFIERYRYSLWEYVVLFGFSQTLGDGGLFFFIAQPHLLLFIPYPALNYHAMNVIPYLAVLGSLPGARSESRARFLAAPAVIGAYLICGAAIQYIGRIAGY